MSMLIVLALLLGTGQGLPDPTTTGDSDASQAAYCDDFRTRSSIVWTCLATVLSCTWVSIHPNIPGPDEGWLKVALRRVHLMLCALSAPELIIAWAMRQRIVARRLESNTRVSCQKPQYRPYVEVFVAHRWTISHGFFALMGGFMLFDGRTPAQTLLSDQLDSLSGSGEIEFPEITEKEVQDRGKGDALAKGVVVLQTGWFVTQIVARKVQGLSITELEVATLAFAALNFVVYALWWHKPLDVKCAVRVYKKQSSDVGGVDDDELVDQGRSVGGDKRGVWAVLQRAVKVVRAFGRHLRDGVPNAFGGGEWWPLSAWLIPFLKVINREDDYVWEEKRVGTFYAGDLSTRGEWAVYLAVATIGTVFGSIHLTTWSYAFPSQTERVLWRVSSLAITCLPAVIAGAAVTVYWVDPEEGIKLLNRLEELNFLQCLEWLFWVLVSITCAFSLSLGGSLYAVFRVILLGLPFVSLRSLPPSAYQTVSWTALIPHLH
jgi:hypothetical protein